MSLLLDRSFPLKVGFCCKIPLRQGRTDPWGVGLTLKHWGGGGFREASRALNKATLARPRSPQEEISG